MAMLPPRSSVAPTERAAGHRAARRWPAAVLGALLLTGVAGCADFSTEAATFTVQPSLTARAVVPAETTPGGPSSSSPVPSPSDGTPGSPPPSGSDG
ncbi:MAG: hypothetical protein ABJD68_17265, partial [Nakamurella sp.]